jgi:hypothetical protein
MPIQAHKAQTDDGASRPTAAEWRADSPHAQEPDDHEIIALGSGLIDGSYSLE